MYFSWKQHQDLSRKVFNAADDNKGIALALMGIGLSMLAADLLVQELNSSMKGSRTL